MYISQNIKVVFMCFALSKFVEYENYQLSPKIAIIIVGFVFSQKATHAAQYALVGGFYSPAVMMSWFFPHGGQLNFHPGL